MHLNCPDEVARYVGATLRDALADPSVRAELSEHPLRIRLGVIDPDCVLYIDTGTSEVRLGAPADVSDCLLAMAGDTAMAYLLGTVDLDAAEASGEVVADARADGLLRLLSSGSRLSRLFTDVLRREGRADLLALAS